VTDEVDALCAIPIALDRAGEPIGAKESESLLPGDEFLSSDIHLTTEVTSG
jgi:hypothetical protein